MMNKCNITRLGRAISKLLLNTGITESEFDMQAFGDENDVKILFSNDEGHLEIMMEKHEDEFEIRHIVIEAN